MKELKQLLDFDPIATAENMLGGKGSDHAAMLGMGLMAENNKAKNLALQEKNDTYSSLNAEDVFGVYGSLGFSELVNGEVQGTDDTWHIFWNKGILLFCETYWGGGSMNSAKIFFNYKGPREAMYKCSNGFAGEVDGAEVWQGSYDCREGLRFALEMMQREGEFLGEWIKAPFLWLLNYKDTKEDGYDYKAINAERIALLPKEVQNAINKN